MDQEVYPPSCIILDNWVFDSLILTGKLFAKALQRFATCLLFHSNLWGNFDSSSELPVIFDDNLKSTSVSFSLQTLIY